MALIGGTITDNMASSRGSGVFVDEESDDKKFSIQGNIQITGNTGSDVYLDGEEVIVIADTLENTAKVGVSMKTISGTFTKGYKSFHSGVDPATFFTADDSYAVIADSNGEAMVIESDWAFLKKDIESAADNATITLDRDWKAIKNDKTIEISAGKHLTLDLNGHKMDGGKAIGTVLRNRGTLVFKDSAQGSENAGAIKGGSASAIENYGTMELKSGTVTGSSADQRGGGIDNLGTLTVSGGTITGNTSGAYGGGIYNLGTLTVSGGTITENVAVREGGGIYLPADNSAVLNVKEEPVIEENQSPIGNNILLCAGKAVTITGGLYPTAKLDVVIKDTASPITSGYASHNRPGVFTYNGKNGLMEEKNSELYLKQATGDTYVSSWTELQNAVNSSSEGEVIVLTADAVCDNNSRLNVENKTVTIELNGHKIDRKRTSNTGNGQVFGVMGTSNLTITDVSGTGVITGGFSSNGGGFFIDTNATVTINGGSVQGNTADSSDGGDGGGVYNKGTLIMEGGAIAFNKADDTGSAIYFDGQKLNTERVKFIDNFNRSDRATIYLQTGEAHIKGGSFLNNFVKYDGGVYVTKNTKLYVEAATYIEDGVEIQEPVTFDSNHADQRGGAILLCDDGSLYLHAITVNDDRSMTGAIHADEDFYISGYIVINKGSSCGVYMEDDNDKINIDGELASGSHIDVELEYKTGSFTKGFKEFHGGEIPETYFSAQEGYAIALDDKGEVKVKGTDWFTLQQMIDNAAYGDTITLTKDYEADDADSVLVIPSGKTLTLDLHGYKLDGSNEIKGGTVLKVENGANLTIEDNYVFPNNVEEEYRESFEGAITGGTASAIVNRGTLTIKGGKIQNNTGGIGGGINNYGTLTITGGRIKANAATQEGGGIHNSGTLNLYGGEIKHNTSASSGGGIFCDTNSKIYVKDAPKVKENNGAAGKNIVLSSGVKITLNGTVDSAAKLDVAVKDYESAITSGYAAKGRPQGVFSYNENDEIILAERDGELYFPYTVNADVWVGSWAELQSAVNNNDNQGKTIGLLSDLTPTGQERIEVEKGRVVTIELAGNTMNRGGGMNLHMAADSTFTNCNISFNKSKDGEGGGIVMNASDKTLTLNNCKVDNNIADDCGGGIYIDAGTVEATGEKCEINSNTSKDGGVYVSGGDTFKLTNKAVVANNKTTDKSGGGITCHGVLEINDATVALNRSAKYGGGVFYQHSEKKSILTNAKILGNEAENDGGGLYIKQGEVELSGGKISTNTSIDGGGVFVTDDTDFTAKNGTEISENISTSEDGGGIAHMDGTVWLKGADVIQNNKSIYGGGIYVEEEADKFYVQDNPVITDNSGSNVYLYKEYIYFENALTTGARISVSTYADTGVFTKDYTKINGSTQPATYFVSDYAYDVYLDDNEAALKWEVVEDPNPFIDRNNNIVDSDKVSGRNWMSAISGERKINEINYIRAHDAAMNNCEANNSSSDITFWALVGGSAGIVGAIAFIAIGLTMGGAAIPGMAIALGLLGGAATIISQVYQSITESQAKTQYHYIDEMMDMGVRVFDLRINNKNWEDIGGDHDDNVNLWHCHGEYKTGGCVYGCDHEGKTLSVNKTLEWAKEFLKKNPTEVLYFEYSPETQDNEKYDNVLATRLYKILKNFSYEINPSTGKPYLYMEDGVFGKEYTYWPKLKDVRGQIVYKYGNVTDDSQSVGGYDWNLNDTSPNYSRAIGENDTINTPYERINQTESAAVEHPSPNILTDAMVHRNFNSGYYVNTTDDPEAAVNWLLHPSKQSYMTKTPLELEEKVLYGDGKWVDVRDTTVWYEFKEWFGTEDWYDIEYEPGYEGLLREGGIVNQTGEYYGVFSFDGVTDKEAKMCWYSNFYEDLEYCTVTVKSGLAGDDTVKTYKVLKGTAITIPNCIYDKPEQSTLYFQNWHAVTGSNNNWEPSYSLQDEAYFGTDYTGIDNRAWLVKHTYEEQINPATQIAQNSEKDVMPGDVVTIMDNTEFTAVWGSEVKAPVTVVWNDGDNGDGLRTDRLELTYQINSVSGTKTATVEDSSNWSAMLTGEVLGNTLKVNWSQVNATTEKPKGDPENGYSYEVTGDINSGFTITMKHKPQKTVTASGIVLWDDNNDVKEIRPDSVTLHLLKNGEEIDSATAASAGGWAYDFGTFPAYTEVEEDGVVTYQRDVYSVIEDPVKCYAVSYNDFDVTNLYVDPDTTDLIVEIDWKDSYNSYGERPETVTLHLWDGDIEIDKQIISVDDEEALTLTYFDLEKYELKHLGETFDYHVTLDSISKYTTEYKDMEENVLVINNTFDNSGKYFQGHSLSLDGDIGVNFYLNLTEDQLSTANIHFEWFDKELELNGSDLVYNAEQHLYKASVPVAAAEMTYNVNAVLYLDGTEVERDRYSVVKYAQVIMSDKDFYDGYIEKMTSEFGDNEKAKEKYSDLLKLVLTMLDYGANAQLVFDRNTDNLANGGVSLSGYDVTSDMIDSKASNMTEDLERYGLEYQYSTVVYLSKTSLRHYYKITDETQFNAIRDGITFDGKNVTPVRKGEFIFFELQSVAACKLDYQYVLKIGDNEYKYSVMDFTKLLLDSDSDKKVIELAKSTYRFSQAADLYFDSSDIPVGTSTENDSSYLRGDANRDGVVNVKDVTAIQRFLSQMQPGAFNEKAADIDGSGLDISDATNIQRYLAEFDDPYNVNELVISEEDPAQSEYESSFVNS